MVKPRKPTNSETVNLLNKIVGKPADLQKTSLKQGGMPRPCFHPNGGIVFVQGNKIKVVNTPQPDKSFSLLDVLLKHRVVSKDESLDSQFSRMAFSVPLQQQTRT